MFFVLGDLAWMNYRPYQPITKITHTDLYNRLVQNVLHSDNTSILRYIPTRAMMLNTLINVILPKWTQQHGQSDNSPDPASIIDDFCHIDRDWTITFFKTLRNDCNGFLSGTIPLFERILVQEPFVHDEQLSNVMQIFHVRSAITYLFVDSIIHSWINGSSDSPIDRLID